MRASAYLYKDTEKDEEANGSANSGGDEKHSPQIGSNVVHVWMVRHQNRRDEEAHGETQLFNCKSFSFYFLRICFPAASLT